MILVWYLLDISVILGEVLDSDTRWPSPKTAASGGGRGATGRAGERDADGDKSMYDDVSVTMRRTKTRDSGVGAGSYRI